MAMAVEVALARRLYRPISGRWIRGRIQAVLTASPRPSTSPGHRGRGALCTSQPHGAFLQGFDLCLFALISSLGAGRCGTSCLLASQVVVTDSDKRCES